MMRALALGLAVLALVGLGLSGKEPLRLKPGDTVAVTSPYGGEFKIQPDGAIYGRGFGRLSLGGLTFDEAQAAMRKALKPFVLESEVHLSLKELRREVVYLVGMGGGKGPVDMVPNLTLRQLLASAPLDGDADLVHVQLFRNGTKMCEHNASSLLNGDPKDHDPKLEPDDVVTLSPVAFHRVWVTGLVARPGQVKVPAGTDVYRAIAQAGGIRMPELAADAGLQQFGRIVVQRGPERTEFPVLKSPAKPDWILEPGDTVMVLSEEEARVTVAGHVAKPGEVTLRGDKSLVAAVARAGGCDPEGTLEGVLVLRRGELYRLDASRATPETPFSLADGDLVFVQRNDRVLLVLGDVLKPGKVAMKDGRAYRLSDALAEAGGLSEKGTLRRVYLCRPDGSGKVVAAQFNLDEYLKDGKLAANPELKPGDAVLFGQPKGITIGSATQILSGVLLFETVTGGKP
jgi:protein involved in polysaccharide export with SLBB domain